VCPCVIGTVTLLWCEGSGGCGPAGAALPGQESSGDGIDYDNKDGGQCHKRRGVEDDDKQ
jgi:hypothetical protein